MKIRAKRFPTKVVAIPSLKEDTSGASEGTIDFNNQSDRNYMGTYFVATSTYTISSINLFLQKVGSPSWDITVALYSNNTNKPGTLISLSSTVASSGVPGTETETSFTLGGSIINGTTYWLVLNGASVGDVSNYIKWHSVSGTYPGYFQTQKSADAITWAGFSNITGKSKIYGL
jgi:hypothetical protein